LSLTFIGGIIFVIGAVQIYTAKIFKKGMVKNGIYWKFRHPQYTGLIIFCIGFLLLWGRFLTYILFTTMFFIYYFLAKKEEKICLDLFGKEYEEYMKKSYFLFPGDKIFKGINDFYNSIIANKAIRIIVAYLLLLSTVILGGFSILKIRTNNLNQIPFVTERIKQDNKDLDIIMIKGGGKRMKNIDDVFYTYLAEAMMNSDRIRQTLSKFDKNYNSLFVFGISRTIREKKKYYKEGEMDLFVALVDSQIKLNENNFNDFRKDWEIKGGFEVSKVDLFSFKKIVNSEISFENIIPIASIKNVKNFINGYFYGFKSNVVPINKLIEK
jgi:hypothetical protein